MKLLPAAVPFATLLVALGSCDSSPMFPDACEQDEGVVNLVVASTESSVSFEWSPGCSVSSLGVLDMDAQVMWSIGGTHTVSNGTRPAHLNVITPPVTYGVLPPGTVNSDVDISPGGVVTPRTGGRELMAGTTYQIKLWRMLHFGSAAECLVRYPKGVNNHVDMCLAAEMTFTP